MSDLEPYKRMIRRLFRRLRQVELEAKKEKRAPGRSPAVRSSLAALTTPREVAEQDVVLARRSTCIRSPLPTALRWASCAPG
jgi:hypothetical protein